MTPRDALLCRQPEVVLKFCGGPLKVRLQEMADWNEIERVPQFARDRRFPDYRNAPGRRDVLYVTIMIEFVKAFPEWQQRAIERGAEQTISQNECACAGDGGVHVTGTGRLPIGRRLPTCPTRKQFRLIVRPVPPEPNRPSPRSPLWSDPESDAKHTRHRTADGQVPPPGPAQRS